MRTLGVNLLGSRRLGLCLSVIFDDVFLLQLYQLLLMSLSNGGFCIDVVFIDLCFVAGVFELLWSIVTMVFIRLVFIAIVFFEGVLASQWIRCGHLRVEAVYIF